MTADSVDISFATKIRRFSNINAEMIFIIICSSNLVTNGPNNTSIKGASISFGLTKVLPRILNVSPGGGNKTLNASSTISSTYNL